MDITKELLDKAKTAKTAAELLELAKAENIELTPEDAEKAFAELHKSGELADEELDNVTGGCHSRSPEGRVKNANQVKYLYHVGQERTIEVSYFTTKDVVILECYPKYDRGDYVPRYKVRIKSTGQVTDVAQSTIVL